MATTGRTAGRPPARDFAAVFGLGIAGALIPVVGWVIGVWLVVRGSSWSPSEKLIGIVGPIVGMLLAVLGTLFDEKIVPWTGIIIGFLIGTGIGAALGLRIPMTPVPQRTALPHSPGAPAAFVPGRPAPIRVTAWPRSTSASASSATTASTPPYAAGGTSK